MNTKDNSAAPSPSLGEPETLEHVHITDKHAVITGDPADLPDSVADDDPRRHNCDQMGCPSLDHVLYRLPFTDHRKPIDVKALAKQLAESIDFTAGPVQARELFEKKLASPTAAPNLAQPDPAKYVPSLLVAQAAVKTIADTYVLEAFLKELNLNRDAQGQKAVADPLAFYRKAPDGSENVVLASHYSKPSEYPDALDGWFKAGWLPLYSQRFASPVPASGEGIDPTFEQWQAGSLAIKCHNDTPHMESSVRKSVAIAVYKAMLAAAPKGGTE